MIFENYRRPAAEKGKFERMSYIQRERHLLLFDNFSLLIVLGIVVLENIPMVRQSCLKSWSVKALMVGIKGGLARSLKAARVQEAPLGSLRFARFAQNQ